jgi:hypothetical protein
MVEQQIRKQHAIEQPADSVAENNKAAGDRAASRLWSSK